MTDGLGDGFGSGGVSRVPTDGGDEEHLPAAEADALTEPSREPEERPATSAADEIPRPTRPFRAWGYPWTAAVVVAGAVVFLAGILVNDTASAVKAMGLLALGLAGRAALAIRAGKQRTTTDS